VGYRVGIFKLLWSPGIDSSESITPSYVVRARICKPVKEPRNRFPAWRAGTTTLFVLRAGRLHRLAESTPRNRFLGSINLLQIRALAGRYDNHFPTRFLAPIDCLKIPAQGWGHQFPCLFITAGGEP
jgi:hypothetical protein